MSDVSSLSFIIGFSIHEPVQIEQRGVKNIGHDDNTAVSQNEKSGRTGGTGECAAIT